MKINLQKFIASSGLCARRKAGELIGQGKVTVNGKPAELGMRVCEDDKVEVEGFKTPLAPLCEKGGIKEGKVYIKLNKPAGYVCTNKKFKGEKNIFELFEKPHTNPSLRQEGITRLFIVGRLDKDSRGLVLLTNDGEMTQRFTHPSYEHEKKYEVKIKNRELRIKNQESRIMNGEAERIIRNLKYGVEIGEQAKSYSEIARVKDARYLGGNKFLVVLTTGKKRQLRRTFASLGYDVEDLLRIGIGKLALGNLKEGAWECIGREKLGN